MLYYKNIRSSSGKLDFSLQWPNLKNLSRGLIMVGSLKIVSNVSRFKPALNLNRVLADLSRDLNSLNSASGLTKIKY